MFSNIASNSTCAPKVRYGAICILVSGGSFGLKLSLVEVDLNFEVMACPQELFTDGIDTIKIRSATAPNFVKLGLILVSLFLNIEKRGFLIRSPFFYPYITIKLKLDLFK